MLQKQADTQDSCTYMTE